MSGPPSPKGATEHSQGRKPLDSGLAADEPSQGTEAPPKSSAGFQPAAAGTAALRSCVKASDLTQSAYLLSQSANLVQDSIHRSEPLQQ